MKYLHESKRSKLWVLLREDQAPLVLEGNSEQVRLYLTGLEESGLSDEEYGIICEGELRYLTWCNVHEGGEVDFEFPEGLYKEAASVIAAILTERHQTRLRKLMNKTHPDPVYVTALRRLDLGGLKDGL